MPRRLLALAAVAVFAAVSIAQPPAPRPKVKLAVVVFFDQMRGDYLDKWRPLFGEGGFKRLQDEGAWFTDCHYPYGVTTTGPGHASVLAGCSADRHGIVNNTWFDRETRSRVYCCQPPLPERCTAVPPRPAAAKGEKVEDTISPGSPDRMLVPTLADSLKESAGGRVFGLSLKNRSAILPAGKRPDGAYWFDGRFVTSTYYRGAVPAWVAAFNQSGKAESYFGKDWTRFRPDLDYEKYSGPDDGPGEGKGKAQGKTFPHPTTGGKDKPGKEYYETLATSPYGSELLLAFAKACVEAEQLGHHEAPDLLTVSFSSNDLIGHAYGPDSQEVLDVTLRSDALMADFLAFLDAKVGKGNYALVVTADHGVCPNPEVSAAKGLDAKRISPTKLLLGAERALRDAYGTPAGTEDRVAKDRNLWIEAIATPYVYLNQRLLKARHIDPDEAAGKLAEWVRQQDGVFRAYTRRQLLGDPAGDEVLALMKKSYHPARGGDLVVVLKPYYLLDTYAVGTTHGTPHEYDRHVPLLVYGPGVPGGRRAEKVVPQQASAIMAHFLGVPPPKACEYGLPATLEKP
jgi:hypothetical protein